MVARVLRYYAAILIRWPDPAASESLSSNLDPSIWSSLSLFCVTEQWIEIMLEKHKAYIRSHALHQSSDSVRVRT